ncbi:MAG: AlpA family phage regulatory protein [Methylobacter sp.]|nr:AlpA family phage regulatory protein [Methylobacter sp.]
MATTFNQLPETGFLRLSQIIGNKKTNTPALIPVSRTSWFNGIKLGKYPKSVKLGERTVAWKAEDIRDLIDSLGNVA